MTKSQTLARSPDGEAMANPFTLLRSPDSEALLQSARSLASEIQAFGDDIEENRRIPPSLVDKLIDTGIWRMGYSPEADVFTKFEVIEAIARADGSTGWCTMLAGGGGGGLPGVDKGSIDRILTSKRDVVAGAVRPSGRAVAVEGGYRIEGSWPFVSGCRHATWVCVGCVVHDGDNPRLDANGRPDVLYCYAPAKDVTILDTWRTTGLRGTGSHDIEIKSCFIPSTHAVRLFAETLEDGEVSPIAQVPGLSLLFHAAVILGIGRHAVDLATEYLKNKIGARGTAVARDAQVQAAIARAEGKVGAARSYMMQVLTDICGAFDRGEEVSMRDRALCRLAISHAHSECVAAVDLLFDIGGGSFSYAKNGMDRILRDVRTANQHIVADYKTFEFAGRMLMGQAPGDMMF